MTSLSQQRTQNYISARHNHPAWMLLASRRAPLMLSGLEALFEHSRDGVPMEVAVLALAELLAAHANQPDYDIDVQDIGRQARGELREWIRRGLVVEREGRVFETDALKTALAFVAQLDGRMMTSTASRLAIVQREIDRLAAQLDPDPQARQAHLQRQLDDLQRQMQQVQDGQIEVLSEDQAVEGVREVYALAISLRADFRRVEDSWREADRSLRQAIIGEHLHRGQVMDRLLDGHAHLLNTQEGRVFDNFHQQLSRQDELDAMRQRIQRILSHPAATKALDDLQHSALRLLVMQLIKEAKVVQAVRARSEREVSQFMKSGQAAENHRVGQLINDVLQQAALIDWDRQAVRRAPSPLPPLGVALGAQVPLIERLRIKSLDEGAPSALLLTAQHTSLADLEAEFWLAFDGLDRDALLSQTLRLLQEADHPLTLSELAARLPPGAHDLETLALWLGMAREAGVAPQGEPEHIDTEDGEGRRWRFTVPHLPLDGDVLAHVVWDA